MSSLCSTKRYPFCKTAKNLSFWRHIFLSQFSVLRTPLIKTLFVCIIFHVSVTSYWCYFALYGIFHLPSINIFLLPLAHSVHQFTDSIGAPVILSSRKINSTSYEITWEPVPHYIHGATIVGYRISYYTVQGSDSMRNITYMVSNSSEYAVVLNGLQRNSNYCVQVRAFTIQEEGPARECVFVRNGKIFWSCRISVFFPCHHMKNETKFIFPISGPKLQRVGLELAIGSIGLVDY